MSASTINSITYKQEVPLMTIAFISNGKNVSREIERHCKEGFIVKSVTQMSNTTQLEFQYNLVVMEKFK